MIEEKMSTTDLLNLLQLKTSLFYLPYGASYEQVEEEYKWRKKVLKIIEERLDKEYNECYNKYDERVKA